MCGANAVANCVRTAVFVTRPVSLGGVSLSAISMNGSSIGSDLSDEMLLSAWYSSDTSIDLVNTIEPLLAANRDAYVAGPLTRQRQDAALQFFDQQW